MLVVLMTYVMTPGAFEFTERGVHFVTHGDDIHGEAEAAQGHTEDNSGDEHGCSGTYHACSCHSSSTFLDSAMVPAMLGPAVRSQRVTQNLGAPVDSGFAAGIDRPPQA